MPLHLSTLARPLVAVAMVAASTLFALAQQPPTLTHLRGTIEAVEGDLLLIRSRGGQDYKLRIGRDVWLVGITRSSLDDIKVGSFIGTTTVPGPEDSHSAVEVHLFPDHMRGIGEGSRPFDLRPDSTITHATVAQTVAGIDGHILLIRYRGGEKKILTFPDTPVVAYVPADRADLKAGAKVTAVVNRLPDGSFEASRVGVGRDGLTPPM